MRRLLFAAMVVMGTAGLCAVGFHSANHETTIHAQAKAEKILNLEEHLKASEEYQKLDTAGKCEFLANLCDKEKKIDYTQKKWMQYRVLMDQARTDGIDKDPVKLCQWVGGLTKDYKNAISKSAYTALSQIVSHYGTKRLYADEAFKAGDVKAKLKRIKELWTARELGQSETYALTNDLVGRFLAAAKGKIDDEIALMGELVKSDSIVWDSTASIQFGLMHRALYEKPELDTNAKRMKWLGEIGDMKTGKLSWMMVGDMRINMLLEIINADDSFTKLDAAGRFAQLDAWVKDGLISSSDKSGVLSAYGSIK